MSQALVVCDNQVLNSLYALNLEVYLGTNVTIQENHESAIKLLELSSNFDFVLSLCLINGQDTARSIYDFIKNKSLEIPLVVLGKYEEFPDDVIVLPATYNIKSIVRTGAKILQITAKDMAEKQVPEYYPIPLNIFYSMESSKWDVYFRVQKGKMDSEYMRIWQKGSKVQDIVRKYDAEGVRHLYIDSVFRLEVVNTASEALVHNLSRDDLTIDEQIENTEQGIEVVAEQIFESKEATEQVVSLSQCCIKTVNEVISDQPKLKNLLGALLANKAGYAYKHMILTTFVANHMIRQISWGGESHVDKLNFVIFFHDIFLVPIYNKYPELRYEEELLFNDTLTEKEKDIVLSHAKVASEMVQTFPRCPLGADAIIAQHHGAPDGVGFAIKYKDNISPLAKVLIIAEHFVEEMLRAIDNEEEFKKDKTISRLRKKFARQTYTKIVDTLENLEM